MLKKIWCIIIISTLLCADIAYPLNKSSSFQDSGFDSLVRILAFVKNNPAPGSQEIESRFNVKVSRDTSGVWLDGNGWRVRFFGPDNNVVPQLDSELIYEDSINNRLKVQIYFKGLSDEVKEKIRAFLLNNPDISELGRNVLKAMVGDTRPYISKIVRREISRGKDETLSKFLNSLLPITEGEYVDAIVSEMGVDVDSNTRDVIKDYVNIFRRRMELGTKRAEILKGGNLFILKKISELQDDKIYKSLKVLFEKTIGEGKRLKIVSPAGIARIVARYEGMKEKDIEPSGIISFTWGDTIYFNNDCRLSDFIVYIIHEAVHLYGGREQDARRMDKDIISVIKGMVGLLRSMDTKIVDLLDSIADVMEYEVLGYELDFHTARLQTSSGGNVFLNQFYLAGINIVPMDDSYIMEMEKHVKGVIRKGRDTRLFSEISTAVKRDQPMGIGMRLFWAFMKYIRRTLNEEVVKREELQKEVSAIEPLYEESVLSYVITKEEAERRLNEVVLNPDAPLFARINDAIMLDIFSETENVELNAVAQIRPILNQDPLKALQILEELRNRKSVELISEFLGHEDYKVRRSAAERLFNIIRSLVPSRVFDSPKTIENLLKFINRPKIILKDKDLTAFLQIVTVLSSIRCKHAIGIFLDILEQNRSKRIRDFVAGALGAIGDTSVIPMVRDRIWKKGDNKSMEVSISCLEDIPNDESAGIIIDTFIKTSDPNLRIRCLKALKTVAEKRRISTDVMAPIIETLMQVVISNKQMIDLNFIIGRIVSIATQEGKMELFKEIDMGGWLEYIKKKKNSSGLIYFSKGLIHDTFMDISDISQISNDNPLKDVFSIILNDLVGNWSGLVEYMQELRSDIYLGRKEYTDSIWKEIADKTDDVKPDSGMLIGREWFQRMCLGIAYRVLLDTWDVGKIEDRDFILELMILRSQFVPEDEMPEGAIGATEAIYGDYVLLGNSLFSSPIDIPGGVNTVWHEATHLVSSMGIADISDISLLGASSHNNIEFYLLSELIGLPPIEDVVKRLEKGESVEDILKDYIKLGVPKEYLGIIKATLTGMAKRDIAQGPMDAFFMVRNINPKKVKQWKWEDVLWKLRKINNEIICAFTIRGKYQILVHTYLDGARFSGYAQRIGIETGFHDATNIYLELLVGYRLRPSQAEFVTRVIAKFMNGSSDILDEMMKGLVKECKDIPPGEINKWLNRFAIEKIKTLCIQKSGGIGMWITYKELDELVDKAFKEISVEMEKPQVQRDICSRVIKTIATKKRIFKVIRPIYKRGEEKSISNIKDIEGTSRPVAIYELLNPRFKEICIDFGKGEEVYAYVDTEKKEIMLTELSDKRINLEEIEKVMEVVFTINEKMQIDSPLEKKESILYRYWISILVRLRAIEWRKLRRYGIYSGLSLGVLVFTFITGYWQWGLLGLLGTVSAIVTLEIIRKRRIIYEDIEFRLSKKLKRELKVNRAVNKGIRKFTNDLEKGNLITGTGRVFLIGDFNRLLLICGKDDLVDILRREFGIDRKVASKIVNYAYKVLEYKEGVDIWNLNFITMPIYIEGVLARIANGQCIFVTEGKKLKRIGLAECFKYAEKDRDRLYDVIRNSYRIGEVGKLWGFIAEEVADTIYDIYLSLEDGEGLDSFVERVVSLDISGYFNPPTTRKRHELIKEFRMKGDAAVTSSEMVFNAVLDSMGVYQGLEYLRGIKGKGEDMNLYWALAIYFESFKIGPGPNDYMPVQILDAWQSFNLWKERVGEIPYEDVQRKFIELYIRYIKDGKGGMPRWGWTFLWLCYFEKDSRMYNAVCDLLREVSLRQDVDIDKIISELGKKYRLTPDERQKLLFTAPVDGFIMLLEIYCRDVEWGKLSLRELEEKLKQDMNVVTTEDVRGEDLFIPLEAKPLMGFIGDVNSWFYTFRNTPGDVEESIKKRLKDEVIELVLNRLNEGGLVEEIDVVRERLYKILELLYTVRLPCSGERFIDSVSIIDLRKVLFDYVRYIVRDDLPLRKLHFAKNLELTRKMRQLYKEQMDKDGILKMALTGDKDIEFSGYNRGYLDEFYTDLKVAKRLLIFTHGHAETIGMLYWIQEILKENPTLTVRIIPQKSMWELNSTKEDILAILEEERKLPVKDRRLVELISFYKKGRFVVLDDCAPGLSWLKGHRRAVVKEEIENADLVLGIGWDNFVSLQGLGKTSYFAFSIDDPIKEELTGCKAREPVFVRICGGVPASRIGMYSLQDYLVSTNNEVYRKLLSYFGGDRIRLHEWVKLEAKRTGKSEVDVICSDIYREEPITVFGYCALEEIDTEARLQALDILLNNYQQFGIGYEVNTQLVGIEGVEIKTGIPVDCYYIPRKTAAVLVKDGKRLILQLLREEDKSLFLRIGDKGYRVEGIVDLGEIIKRPELWIGNAELVEFFGAKNICEPSSNVQEQGEPVEKERGLPGVSIEDIPQYVTRRIPQIKPGYIYEIAEKFFTNPIPYPSLQLHYAVVLLSSLNVSQRVKGLEELERLRRSGDKETLDIINRLSRVIDWAIEEVPSDYRDIFSLTNFTSVQEKILGVVRGGHQLRPPFVEMPGQGVSNRFFNLVRKEISGFDIDLVRNNYAEGVGSVLFGDGTRQYIRKGDLLLELFRRLLEGQMLGAVRLRRDGEEIIQIPINAGILNYLKVLHHLSHIISTKFIKARGGEPDLLGEFTPTIEDIIIIKYVERIASNLKDGFSDFRQEVGNANSEGELRMIFERYGLNYPSDKDFTLIKDEISNVQDMKGFSDYIEKNNLGSFISLKEFLKVLIDYTRGTVKEYIRQLPFHQQIILERLLTADTDTQINNLLIIASQLAGCYIPKVDFQKVDIFMNLLSRPGMVAGARKDKILERIEQILEGGEPFSAKAVKIVGTILYRMGINVTAGERREIEEKVMDVLSGRWWQTLQEALTSRIIELEKGGVDAKDLREKLKEVCKYTIGAPHPLGEVETTESKPVEIDEIKSWAEIIEYVKKYNIKRVFCDIDKTIIDAPGFITSTPWFREMAKKKGLKEAAKEWRRLEEGVVQEGKIHLMEDCIPEVIKQLKKMGVEVILYTSRAKEDITRTKRMLRSIGIKGLEIITSKAGPQEQKRQALVEYYEGKGWFGESVPTLYIDDMLINLKTVCSDSRFSHIRGVWYHAHYQKRYEVNPEEFLNAGDNALKMGKTIEALVWYMDAAYVMSRKDIVNQVYDIVAEHMGVEVSIEEVFSRITKDRLNRYKGALERERVWIEAAREERPEKKEIKWFTGAPNITSPGFLEGIKRIIVIGSHPHGDHVKGFLDYAKRRMKNLVDTVTPRPGKMKTGGPITHSLSNYWGRIGEETIVLFDLGWFPEGFVDSLIQTIHPRDREILFIMDPDTERTLSFKSQVQRLKQKGVRLEILPYEELLNIPIEKGRVLQIENYPAYHMAPQVGSSIYIIRVLDANTQEEIQSIGYVSEIGDIFPQKMDEVLLEKLASLDRIIVDGTNLIAPMGEEPVPLAGRLNKAHEYVKELNRGEFLIAHFNTQSIGMIKEAEVVAENLDPGIPIIILGGKDTIGQLKDSYRVPEGQDYYAIGSRKVYLVHDVARFHRKWREAGNVPSLDDVLGERIEGLKKAGWTEDEINGLISEWKKNGGLEISTYKGPGGKVKELEALLWDLRKTKAVIISSGQFRGDIRKRMYQNYKGFQVLDAIVDRPDACILIEGRLHLEGKEGAILRVLVDKKEGRVIPTITGRKKVRTTIDNQWRSGHITFESLMDLLNRIADESIGLGNAYSVRTYIPVPQKEWFSMIPEDELEGILLKYGYKSLDGVIDSVSDIINRWNNRRDVSHEEIQFVKKVIKKIFENSEFFQRYFGTSNVKDLQNGLLNTLEKVEKESRLQGKAYNRIFVASTSKFIEVLRKVKVVTESGISWTRQLMMDPEKLSRLFNVAGRFTRFELGIGPEYGETVDLITKEKEIYSRDLMRELNRGYLKELYSKAQEGKIPPDLSMYLTQKKGLEEFRKELAELLENAKKKAHRKGEELFNIWFGELKGYVESQFLRIGLRYVDKVAPYSELRGELSLLYDAVIEFVYNYVQEDMKWEYKDIAIVSGDDYAQRKVLFKDAVRLGILIGEPRYSTQERGERVDKKYAILLYKRIQGILNTIGIPVEPRGDWIQFLHKRIVVSSSKDVEKGLVIEIDKNRLKSREGRFSADVKSLEDKKGFDVHTGPGGLEDIDLIRYFYSSVLSSEEKTLLDETEEFLRRYKEEVGYSTGGDKKKAGELLKEVMDNLGFMGTRIEFMEEFFKKISRTYKILQRVMSEKKTKNISFGDIDEEEDIHKGVFEKAAREKRLLGEDFGLIDELKRENPVLRSRKFQVIKEEQGKPTIFYREEPFGSVLSHSGKRTNTIYMGLNILMLVDKRPEHREALRNLILHENRDIERGYHMDLEDEVREGIITHSDVDGIYALWNDLLTGGRFGIMYNLYLKRAKKRRFREYFLDRIPADIRIINPVRSRTRPDVHRDATSNGVKGKGLYEFKHGDSQDLPDLIGLNLRLFEGCFSPQTQVFLLRHCTDRVRYDRYKTIINDVKYLLIVPKQEREKILEELKELEYIKFLRQNLGLDEGAKGKIREYVGLRFGTYTTPDGANIWYTVGGNLDTKRTLVFLHGIGVNSRDWRHQITFFEKDYRIITIDLRGFGKSEGLGSNPPHIKNYAEDVEGILSKEGITDAILIGHSMGGIVALNMDEIYMDIPLEKRRIKGLVLINSIARDPTESFFSPRLQRISVRQVLGYMLFYFSQFEFIWNTPLFKKLARSPLIKPFLTKFFEALIIQKETHPLFTEKVIKSVFMNDMDDLIYGFRAIITHNVEDRLGNLGVPVMWIIGEKDKIVLPQEQEKDAKKIKDCRVVRLPGAIHYPHATFPRRVNKEINRFINGGIYRFSQLVCSRIKERFLLDVSLDALEAELRSIKMRFVPKLISIKGEDLRLIEDISSIVMSCGLQTGVSLDTMIKTVVILATQILPEPSITLPPAKPISHEELEDIYKYIVESV